jgi:hypothetical protein
MKKNAVRVFALFPGAALLMAGALQASTITSDKVEIPFQFSVQHHKTMPAGEYQVVQQSGTDLATLVNTKTGERVELLRPQTTHQAGKTHLVFENTSQGRNLKSIS